MELLAYSQESVPEKNLQLTARVVAFYCPLQTIVRADKHENRTFGSIIYDAREGEARKCKKGVEPCLVRSFYPKNEAKCQSLLPL